MPIFCNLFQNAEAEGTCYNSILLEDSTLILKTRQRHYKKGKLKINVSHGHRCKNPQQNTIKFNETMCKRIICHGQVMGFTPGMQDWVKFFKKSIHLTTILPD